MKLGDLITKAIPEFPKLALMLERLGRSSIAKVRAPGKASDYIKFCRERRLECGPSTIHQQMCVLRGVLAYAKPGWDLNDITDAPIREAWPILKKERLVGCSNRRTRVPSADETERLCAYFVARGNQRMADLIRFQGSSSRRLGETCRIQRGGLNEQTKTIIVRDMKHPWKKDGNHIEVALPNEALAILLRQPRISLDPTERFFPLNPKSVSQSFRAAAEALGIADLHLHDYRRLAATRLLAQGYTVPEVMLVTGHVRPDLVFTTYNGLRAEDFHKRTPA